MAIRIDNTARVVHQPEIPRCPIDGVPYGDDGVPVCSVLHGRPAVIVVGGN